jgi:hypothetical protein
LQLNGLKSSRLVITIMILYTFGVSLQPRGIAMTKREKAIARLIASQRSEDANGRKYWRRRSRATLEADLGARIETVAVRVVRRGDLLPVTAEPDDDLGWHFLLGPQAWSMVEVVLTALGERPCPVCGGYPIGNEWCLYCDACNARHLPGVAVGEHINPDAKGTSYVPGKLAGGTGETKKRPDHLGAK